MTTAAAASLVGQILMGKLRVVRLLGEGGMGAVYEVEHLITKHRRALKVLHGEFAKSPEAVARFVREAGVAGTLRSQFVVETYDAGQLEDGSPYVVMEMLEGMPLSEILQKHGRLLPGQITAIMLDVCEGLASAHSAGIIHRDLKPDNLFLVRSSSGNERAKILDFGISKFTDERGRTGQKTTEGMAIGTPSYMPAEQLQGLPDIDARADIYALGVILYEALAGTRPFEAPNYVALALRVYQGDYPKLRTLVPEIPEKLEAIVARAMSTDRDARYQNVRQLAVAIEEFAQTDTTDFLGPAIGKAQRPTSVARGASTLPHGSDPPRGSRAATMNEKPPPDVRATEPEATPAAWSTNTAAAAVPGLGGRRTGLVVTVVVLVILAAGAITGLVLKKNANETVGSDEHAAVPDAGVAPLSIVDAGTRVVAPAVVDAGPAPEIDLGAVPSSPNVNVVQPRTRRRTDADRAGLHTQNPYGDN